MDLSDIITAGYVLAVAFATAAYMHWVKGTSLLAKLRGRSPFGILVLDALLVTLLLGVLLWISASLASPLRAFNKPASDSWDTYPRLATGPRAADLRVDFGGHSPPTVMGYPSTGGVLSLPLDIVVAEYLGLPRLEHTNPSNNTLEEDAFCDRLRLMGAQWRARYVSCVSHFYYLLPEEVDELIDDFPIESNELFVGWPSNSTGVWILRQNGMRERPSEAGKLRLCLTMDERCSLLEAWGATFVDDPSTVPEFKSVFERKEESGESLDTKPLESEDHE